MEQEPFPQYVSFRGLRTVPKMPEEFRLDWYNNVIHREMFNLSLPLGWTFDEERNIITHWRAKEKREQCGVSKENLYRFLHEKYVFGVHIDSFFGFDISSVVESLPPRTLEMLIALTRYSEKFNNCTPVIEEMALELPPAIALHAINVSFNKETPKYLEAVLRNKLSELSKSVPFTAPLRKASPVKITCFPEARPLKTQTVEKVEQSAFSKFIVKIRKVKISETSEKHMEDVVVSNRIIRYVGDPLRFLVVSFDKATYESWKTNENWKNKIRSIFLNGFILDNKLYKFVGFSSSGIRERQSFFFNEGQDHTIASLRAAMGDFSDALRQGISKYIARFGQTFSKSIETVDVDPQFVIEKYHDFKENGYIFSDGCGMICESLAKKVAEILAECFPVLINSNKQIEVPSVFQIRYKGNKGVVAVYPDHSLPFKGTSRAQLVLRKSMWKFDSPPTKLEILNFSSSSEHASLNRQIIHILKEQKIPNEVFVNLAEDYLKSVKNVLTNEVAAFNFLIKQDTIPMRRLATMVMADHGLHEPHLRTSLISLITKKIEGLEAKLKIPLNKARYLIGVIDETGTLRENEVYVNVKQRAISQRVIVTRNPCRHPGDVRVLEAVHCLELAHLRDCIVFPRVGQRPVMDMMSGGDLDGDMFFVCWDESLIPELENVIPPLEYPKPTPPTESFPDASLESRMVEFFLKFTATNELGLISQVQDIATELYGPMHEISIQLAIDSSRAVDAVKTGEFVQLNPEFRDLYQKKPEWMGGNNTHCPLSVVGQISTLARKYKTDFLREQTAIAMEVDPDLLYKQGSPQWQEKFNEAVQFLIRDYNLKLKEAINVEEQTKPSAVMKMKLGGSKVCDMLREEYEAIFESGCKTMEDRLVKASAWYCAAYQLGSKAFGWIPIEYLNRLKVDSMYLKSNEIGLSVGRRWLKYLKGNQNL